MTSDDVDDSEEFVGDPRVFMNSSGSCCTGIFHCVLKFPEFSLSTETSSFKKTNLLFFNRRGNAMQNKN